MPPTAKVLSLGLPDSSRKRMCTAVASGGAVTLCARFRRRLPTSPWMRRFHNQPLLSPSDLNDLLECRHLMALKLAAFQGKPGPRPTYGAHTEILVRYGEQHEQAILERFV